VFYYQIFSLQTRKASYCLASVIAHLEINIYSMSSWNCGGSSSSNLIEKELVILNIVDDFSSDDIFEDMEQYNEIVPIPTMKYNQYLQLNTITSPMDTTSILSN